MQEAAGIEKPDHAESEDADESSHVLTRPEFASTLDKMSGDHSKDVQSEKKTMVGGPGQSSTSTNIACAACKYQRRKCAADCPLAPYFPPDQPKKFLNVHRLFGVSSILRILRHVDPDRREDAVKSIVYEADTREKDPVHGCLGVIHVLQEQLKKLKQELALAREQLYLLEQQHQASILQPYGLHHGGGHGYYIPQQLQQQLHQQLQHQYLPPHQSGNYHNPVGQSMSFQEIGSAEPAFHDHSRFGEGSSALQSMLGQQLKVEGADPYSRAVMHYGADSGPSLHDEHTYEFADFQRRNYHNPLAEPQLDRHVDPLRSAGGFQTLDPLSNEPPHVSEHHELRNAGVHLSLKNQYSL